MTEQMGLCASRVSVYLGVPGRAPLGVFLYDTEVFSAPTFA
jgi:hypothetical protein